LGHQKDVGEAEVLVALRSDLVEAFVREVGRLDMAPYGLAADEYMELALKEVLHLVEVEVWFIQQQIEELLMIQIVS
jgi:hypothetical protein